MSIGKQQSMFKINLAQQIDEVKSEIAMRERVYPRMIGSGKLSQRKADFQIERMKAVLATLEWLVANEDKIKQKVAPQHDRS